MNKATYRKNYNALLRKTIRMLEDYREAALKSKAFDLAGETAEFQLPKNVMCAALQECRDQWAPPVRQGESRKKNAQEKEIKNIYIMTYLP